VFNPTVIRYGLALGLLGLVAACGRQTPPQAPPPAPAAEAAPTSQPPASQAPAEPARTEPAPTGQGPSNADVTLTVADTDRAFRLQRGQTVELRLASDRASGFTWIPTHDMRPMMSTDGMPQYEVDQDAGPGGPGTEIWRFIAREPGHVHLVFEYRRPFDAGAPPAQAVVYHFDIE
jgi:predicted secreted protein